MQFVILEIFIFIILRILYMHSLFIFHSEAGLHTMHIHNYVKIKSSKGLSGL